MSDPVDPRAVDVHAHLFPQSAVRAEAADESWFGSTFGQVDLRTQPPVVLTGGRRAGLGSVQHREPPEQRVRRMDAMGVRTQVVSLLPPLFRYELPADLAVPGARVINAEISEMQRAWPDRFIGLATLPLPYTAAAMDELEWALSSGLAGFAIGSHVNGLDLDAPELRPLFRRASEYECFVLCHPVAPRAGTSLSRFYLSNVIGNPLETTVAFSTLVLGGVLDEAPGMKVCFAHAGGYIAAAAGRLNHAYRVRPETRGSEREPRSYLRSVYVDSLTHDQVGLEHVVEHFGADRVLLGSDYPADMGNGEPVGAVRATTLSAGEQDSILFGNAERLFSTPRRRVPTGTVTT